MRVAIVSAILFLSGCSALLFQMLWLRLSGLAFGNSVWSAALILSSFMAGLALGSAIAASSALGRLRPLRVYAGLEMMVALVGSTLVFGIPLLGEWMRPAFQALWEHQPLLNVLRFAVSFLILLFPTTAMGLTLPVLLEDPLLKRQEFGRGIGFLYGGNTLGAMAGALLGEIYLVQRFGPWGTAWTAAGGGLHGGRPGLDVCRGRAEAGPEKSIAIAYPLFVGIATALAAAHGRDGGRRGSPWPRSNLGSLPPFVRCFYVRRFLGHARGRPRRNWSRKHCRQPDPRSPSAATTPDAVASASRGERHPSFVSVVPHPGSGPKRSHIRSRFRAAGRVPFPCLDVSGRLSVWSAAPRDRHLCSIRGHRADEQHRPHHPLQYYRRRLGAPPGRVRPPASTRLPVQPGFLRNRLHRTCLANDPTRALVSAASLWSSHDWRQRGLRSDPRFFPHHRDESHLANARRLYEADGSVLAKKIEGTADTYQLLRRDLHGQPYYYRLVTNSYSMSGTVPRTQRYMRMFAYLPLALRPESENALLICYGVGVTADAFTRDTRLKHLDIVDISQEIFDLAGSYTGAGYANPLRDSRVKTVVQDGRFFLQASPTSYDIITGEPPPLKVAGAVNLYTQQFFSLMKGRLKEGGIVSFWLPIYQVTVDETKAILRAFITCSQMLPFGRPPIWSGSWSA